MTLIQSITFVISCVVFLACIFFFYYSKEHRTSTVQAILWIANVILRYIVLIIISRDFLSQNERILINSWGAVISLHALLIILGVIIIEIYEIRRGKTKWNFQ